MKIAVVGGGIAGIISAHVLSREHQVTLFDRNDYLGGHTNTRLVSDRSNPELAVDTGFIVCNARNYPHFYTFLDQLGVARQDSDMTFGFSCEKTGLQYMGPSISEFIKTPLNLARPRFLRMIVEQQRFNARARSDLTKGTLGEIPLGEYLRSLGVSSFFLENYLAPLIGSIWSAPDSNALEFPALTFLTFFNNHGMLELSSRPQWQTVVGGSHAYTKAFRRCFSGELRLGAEIAGIRRDSRGIRVTQRGEEAQFFDRIIVATHADEALRLLEDPSNEEVQALGTWRYSRNTTVLHTDSRVLGPARRLWAAWNYRRRISSTPDSPVAITYYMNKLQRLQTENDYFVTLNPDGQIDPSRVLYETVYTHPIYTPQSPASQRAIATLNGSRGTYFCGAYMRYGFHEDAVVSALNVAADFGLRL